MANILLLVILAGIQRIVGSFRLKASKTGEWLTGSGSLN